MTLKVGATNNANEVTHSINANNIYTFQGLESSAILYSINQSTDLQL